VVWLHAAVAGCHVIYEDFHLFVERQKVSQYFVQR
jgi:hypothetical protein